MLCISESLMCCDLGLVGGVKSWRSQGLLLTLTFACFGRCKVKERSELPNVSRSLKTHGPWAFMGCKML